MWSIFYGLINFLILLKLLKFMKLHFFLWVIYVIFLYIYIYIYIYIFELGSRKFFFQFSFSFPPICAQKKFSWATSLFPLIFSVTVFSSSKSVFFTPFLCQFSFAYFLLFEVDGKGRNQIVGML